MSSLSSLLNPAPNSTENAPSKALQLTPLQLDGQDYRSQSHPPGDHEAQSPTHHTVTSPGLDVLATAASKTAPLMSSVQQQSSTAQAVFQGQAHNLPGPEMETEMFLGSQVNPSSVSLQNPSSSDPHPHLDTDHDQKMPDYKEDSSKVPATSNQSSTIQHNAPSVAANAITMYPEQPSDPKAVISSYANAHTQYQPDVAEVRDLPASEQHSFSANKIEQVHVKAELAETPGIKNGTSMLMASSATGLHDSTPGTPLKNVMSNFSPDSSSQVVDSSVIPPKPKAAPAKKRPAPKKGTAVKPPAKKRKVDTESGKGSSRTGTPATSRASGTPAPKKGKHESATPTRSSSVVEPEDDEDDGEPELFCICRKPDDHTVMIGCDGPCEDWFHTRCVSMTNEKVALISKWYCPNCAAEGHETEWKRMCRLAGCSKPALTEGPQRSKYCCKEHGQEFMERHLSAHEKKLGGANASKRRRRDNYTDHDGNETDEKDEQSDNRGGVLRPGELKALVDGVKDVATFMKLGDGVLSPPETAATSPGYEAEKKIAYNSEEAHQIDEIAKKRAEIEARRDMLNDRDKLVHMVDRRRKEVLTKLKEKEKTLKDICGYDARLTWSDEELNEWRHSKEGHDQLQSAVLNADPRLVDGEKGEDGGEGEVGPGVCKKKRCERHRTWYKVQQQDNAMEREDVKQRLKRLDEEEKGVKERAMIRSLEEGYTAVG